MLAREDCAGNRDLSIKTVNGEMIGKHSGEIKKTLSLNATHEDEVAPCTVSVAAAVWRL
jgi:hypothetical protein